MDWIWARAREVLAAVPDYVWDGERLPVPVDDIVDTVYGLQIVEVEDMTRAPGCPALEAGQSLSGLLLADRKEIWCNAREAREWPGRRRFTVAHELGHWVMHRPGQQALFCRHGVVAEDGDHEGAKAKRPVLPEAEQEANAFAAELCMPAALLAHHYRNTTRDFAELCEMFGSSGAAMGRRLHQVV